MASGLDTPRRTQVLAGSKDVDASQSMLGLSHIARGPKWSLKGRYREGAKAEGPGPGEYSVSGTDATSKFLSNKGYGFGTSLRDGNDKQRVPGPGSYAHKRAASVPSPSYSLTPRRHDRGPSDLPGPGTYGIKSSLGEGPKYSASVRLPDLNKNNNPTPWHYTPRDTRGPTAQALAQRPTD